jgi:transcriptional regulator of acetoin/glycerol metabolism
MHKSFKLSVKLEKELGETMMPSLEESLSPVVASSKSGKAQVLYENDCLLMDKIKQQKMDLLAGKITPAQVDSVRPEIVQSWLKSSKKGHDPLRYKCPPIINSDAFEDLLKEKDFFLQAADPYIRQLESMLTHMQSFLFLSDEKGIILRVGQALGKNKFQLVPGTMWSEETTGTCAHDLCIQLKRPIQLCGSEHFSEIFKNISCSSAPVFDEKGHLEGTLTITSPYLNSQNSHSLGLVVTMTRAIEKEFQLSVKNNLFDTIFSKVNEAMIVFDNCGVVININAAGRKIFDALGKKPMGKQVEELFDDLSFLRTSLASGEAALNKEISIKNSKLKNLCSVYPLENYDNKNSGYILILKPIEVKNVHKRILPGSSTRFTFNKIVGDCAKFTELEEMAKKFSRVNSSIMLLGESGTGKEVFAQAIHNESRPNNPFIAVNCAAIPRNLIESELFGYEAGAFTGAKTKGKPGKIELANNGTLFLDEIGDMPLDMQAVLLRVLEDKTIMRVGGSRYIPVDFRLITATNKDLLTLTKENLFREDLYYRLSVFRLNIPPLRERGSDIIQLAERFINIYAQAQRLAEPVLSNSAKYILLQYSWPGNVRQLQNAISYAVCLSSDGIILPEHLPGEILDYYISSDLKTKEQREEQKIPADSYSHLDETNHSIKDIEKMAIKKALNETNNRVRDAAKLLGLSKSTLYRKIKEYEIK